MKSGGMIYSQKNGQNGQTDRRPSWNGCSIFILFFNRPRFFVQMLNAALFIESK